MNEIVLNRENEHLAAIIAAITDKSVEEIVENLIRASLKRDSGN